MEPLLAFAATLLALRLAGRLAGRWREQRTAALAAWAAALLAFAAASAALTWGSAAGWSEAPFRAYYLFGGLLTAPLLGAGSLLLAGKRLALPAALVYVGLAVGLVLAEPLRAPVGGDEIPEAQDHLDLFPARIVAIVGNSVGTLAVAAVALTTIRRRPLGNALILGGVAVAALGSALFGLGVSGTSASLALAALLLYAGFVAPARRRRV